MDYEQEILKYYGDLVEYREHLREVDAYDLAYHICIKMGAIEELMKKLHIEYKKE